MGPITLSVDAEHRGNIKLPRTLTSELAEDIGWQIGDGCITKKNWFKMAGDPIEEKPFYDEIVVPTKNRLFGTNFKARPMGDGSYGVQTSSKELVYFYNKVIGLPLAPKTSITIPKIILDSEQPIIISCIRGIFDTDGTLVFGKKRKTVNHYPSIQIESISKPLIKDLMTLLKGMGLNCCAQFDMKRKPTSYGYVRTTNRLFIEGKSKLEMWMDIIGFNSPKHKTKYLIWRKFGHCPPRIRLTDRIAILEGKVDINTFYKDKT